MLVMRKPTIREPYQSNCKGFSFRRGLLNLAGDPIRLCSIQIRSPRLEPTHRPISNLKNVRN